jgi:hypothetical protein
MAKKSSSSSSLKPKANDEPVKPQAGLGWPGYRTREGRTGWDPIDADNEAAHMTGTILQRLFYGRVRRPLHLFLLGLLGVILALPAVLAILDMLKGNPSSLGSGWLLPLIAGLAGLVILVNFTRNLIANLSR